MENPTGVKGLTLFLFFHDKIYFYRSAIKSSKDLCKSSFIPSMWKYCRLPITDILHLFMLRIFIDKPYVNMLTELPNQYCLTEPSHVNKFCNSASFSCSHAISLHETSQDPKTG